MSLHDEWLNTSRKLTLEYHELQNTNRGPSVYLRGFLWNMVECVLRHRDYTVLCFDKASEWKSLIYTYFFFFAHSLFLVSNDWIPGKAYSSSDRRMKYGWGSWWDRLTWTMWRDQKPFVLWQTNKNSSISENLGLWNWASHALSTTQDTPMGPSLHPSTTPHHHWFPSWFQNGIKELWGRVGGHLRGHCLQCRVNLSPRSTALSLLSESV